MKYPKLNELIKEWERESFKREYRRSIELGRNYDKGYIDALHRCIQDVKTLILTNKEI